VPRFRCKGCRRTFSRQTFRIDYHDRRPDCNVPLFEHLVSGSGLRQCGRLLRLSVHSVQRKFHKLARHLRLLNRNLVVGLPALRKLVFDEFETHETNTIRPLTVPVLLDGESWLILDTRVAPIRRCPRRGSRAHRRLMLHEMEYGRRVDRGHDCVRRSFGRMQRLLGGRPAVLATDLKSTYASMCRRRFGVQVAHERIAGTAPRNEFNPLLPINNTELTLRAVTARLRGETWLISKERRYLALHLALFQAYRNWHRQRFNGDPPGTTPGVCLGVVPRMLECDELLAWRQDWRRTSIHPASADGATSIAQAAA
jgi:hypothetical protein